MEKTGYMTSPMYSLEVYIMRNEQTDTLQSLIVAYNAKGEKVDPVFCEQISGTGSQTKKHDGQDRGQRRYKNSDRSDVDLWRNYDRDLRI